MSIFRHGRSGSHDPDRLKPIDRVRGLIVGIYDGGGSAAGFMWAVAAGVVAREFDVRDADVANLAGFAFAVTAAGFLFGSIFGSRLGGRYVVLSAALASAAFVGVAVAPSWGWVAALAPAVGVFDSASPIARGALNRHHPLPRSAQTEAQNAVIQAGFSGTLAAVPIAFLVAVGLFGLRGAWIALGIGYAAVAAATVLALRGGQAPEPSRGRARWDALLEALRVALAGVARTWQARRSPAAVARLLASPPVVTGATAMAVGLHLGPISTLASGRLSLGGDPMPWFGSDVLAWVVAITVVFRIATALAMSGWPALVSRLRKVGRERRFPYYVAISRMLIVVPVALQLASPGSIWPLFLIVIVADLGVSMTLLGWLSWRATGAAISRLVAGLALGGFTGVLLGNALVDLHADALKDGADPGLVRQVDLTLGVWYLALVGFSVLVAHLAIKVHRDSLSRLREELPAGSRDRIHVALGEAGIQTIGALVANTQATLEAIVGRSHAEEIVAGLDRLGYSLRQRPEGTWRELWRNWQRRFRGGGGHHGEPSESSA